MLAFYEELKKQYPNSVELIELGKSFEGRPLVVVKVQFALGQ